MTVQVVLWPRGIQRVKAAGPLAVEFDGEDPRVGRPVFATDIGWLASASVSTRWEDGFGGEDIIKFTLLPNGGFIGGMFRPGDHVRVLRGGGMAGEAELSEVVPQADGTVEFTAKGYAYNLYDYDSVAILEDGDVSYPTTQLLKDDDDDPTDLFGWEYAQSIGLPINQVIGNTGRMEQFFGEQHAAEAPVKLGTVITESFRPDAIRWAVWGRTLVFSEDPTTAKWAMDAPEGLVGTADTDYATHVGVLYVDSEVPPNYDDATVYDGNDKVVFEGEWWIKIVDTVAGFAPGDTVTVGSTDFAVWAPLSRYSSPRDWDIAWAVQDIDGINVFDARTVVVDYRGRGASATTNWTEIAQGLLDQVKGRFVLNGSFTVGRESGFRSANGGYAGDALAFVKAGDGLQLNQVRTTQGNVMPAFQVIGKTEWTWDASDGGEGSERLTITPMGAVARNLSTILAGIPLTNTR